MTQRRQSGPTASPPDLPPYVLGADILGFLPGENKSYAHAYANFGVPTYIRILKDISTTEADKHHRRG
ncbi:MAG: hypothetical protein U5R30_01060 [Deltaproteobacteria bacterium]|nr:hypothetical protein [Deltaproteobacteria bacterium]